MARAIAPARLLRLLPGATRPGHRGRGAKTLLLAVAFGCASPAAAQLSGSLSFRTDDRFRGHSLSQGQPTLALDLSYDHPSGLYLDVVVRGVATHHAGPQLLAA